MEIKLWVLHSCVLNLNFLLLCGEIKCAHETHIFMKREVEGKRGAELCIGLPWSNFWIDRKKKKKVKIYLFIFYQ